MSTNETLQIWGEKRAKVLSTKQSVKVLNALKALEGTKERKKTKSMYELWQALEGVGYQSVVKALKRLEKDDIVCSEEVYRGQVKRREYSWTLQGVLLLPELAPVEGTLVEGGLAGVMQSFLGEYEDVVNYISAAIEVDLEISDTLLLLFLKHTITFLSWIRECIFPITGIRDPEDHEFFREKMLVFMFELLLLPSLLEDNLQFLGAENYHTITSKLWENRMTQVRDIITRDGKNESALFDNEGQAKSKYNGQLYV